MCSSDESSFGRIYWTEVGCAHTRPPHTVGVAIYDGEWHRVPHVLPRRWGQSGQRVNESNACIRSSPGAPTISSSPSHSAGSLDKAWRIYGAKPLVAMPSSERRLVRPLAACPTSKPSVRVYHSKNGTFVSESGRTKRGRVHPGWSPRGCCVCVFACMLMITKKSHATSD